MYAFSATSTQDLGHGIGLRSSHIQGIMDHTPAIDWFEVVSENYMHTQGIAFENLLKVRQNYPIALHGVTLSIGSAQKLNQDYLRDLKNLSKHIDPVFISDHLCWTHINNHYSHDLLPLPQNQKVIEHVVSRVDQVQNYLQRSILLENASTYVSFKEDTMPEQVFIQEIAQKSGCGILLDINNVYVNAYNHQFDPKKYLDEISEDKIGYLHLAGHTDRKTYLFDTHSAKMTQGAWNLYNYFVQTKGKKPTLVEWDNQIPELSVLMEESKIAKDIEQRVLA